MKIDTQSIPSALLKSYKAAMTEWYSWKTLERARRRIKFELKSHRSNRSKDRIYL